MFDENLLPRKTPELWFLNNDADDTFTCVPSIDNPADLELMKKCFEKAGINFDTEKSAIQLKDFTQVSNMIVSIDKQDMFVKDYLMSVVKEQELIAQIEAIRHARNLSYNLKSFVSELKVKDELIGVDSHEFSARSFIKHETGPLRPGEKIIPLQPSVGSSAHMTEKKLLSDTKLEPGKEFCINSKVSLEPVPTSSIPILELRQNVSALNKSSTSLNICPFSPNDMNKPYASFNPIGGPDGGMPNQKACKRENTKHNVLVLFNEMRMVSVAFDTPSSVKNMKQLVKKYPEYGFRVIVDMDCTYDIKNTVVNTFNGILHPSIESLHNKLEFCDKYIQAMRGISSSDAGDVVETEEDTVLSIMRQRFVITDNVEQRMKAQDIFDFFTQNASYLPFKIDTMFRNRLSKYLIKLGLTKKRYSDGYYYYGIVKREDKLPVNHENKYDPSIIDDTVYTGLKRVSKEEAEAIRKDVAHDLYQKYVKDPASLTEDEISEALWWKEYKEKIDTMWVKHHLYGTKLN